MITAHLPAGYVLARSTAWTGTMMLAALLGAVFPDFDLLFFYFVDDRAFHHHKYWVHAPAFALLVVTLVYVVAARLFERLRGPVIAFGVAWMLHILLDSLSGGIMWLWPFSDELHLLFEVPGREGIHFLVAFLTHWTILFEVAIWIAALWLFWQTRIAS